MRKPQFASRKSTSYTGWWKHARLFGKRTVNKSERKGAKKGTSVEELIGPRRKAELPAREK